MIYKIVHRTTYKYKISRLRRKPCGMPEAAVFAAPPVARSELRILPSPPTRTERVDFFGNLLCFFTIQEPHRELVVEARAK